MGDQPQPPRSAHNPTPRSRPSTTNPTATSAPSSRPLVIGLSLLTVVVVIAVVLVFTGGGDGTGVVTTTPSTVLTTPGTGSTVVATTLPDSEFRSYVDEDAGFSIRYPKAWERFQPADPSVHLIAAMPPPADGPADIGLTVRVTYTEVPTTSENLDNLKTVTDGIVASNPTVKVLREQKISGEIDGMPGFYYLYTFTDEATGRLGAHGHYFLFRGRKMNQIVLQAIPTEEYGRLGAMFDQIIDSFKSTAETATVPTTAAP